ncbi:MAG: F0F1 ATP synthase subunit A [Rhodothermales bacterium]|nr:F0F1 ATP synthase subunit A [Rhodothermales bacterium]
MLVIAVPAMSAVVPADDEEELDAVHHVADGDYLDFSPFGKVYLPRIFLIRDADGGIGINFFGSTKKALASGAYHFEDLHAAADDHSDDEHAGETEADDHSDDSPASDASAQDAGHDDAADAGHSEDGILVPVEGDLLLDLSITRHLVFVWFIALLVIVIFSWMARRYAAGIGSDTAPQGKVQNALEAFITWVRDDIARPNIGPKADKYVPYLLTLWFFILGANLIGLVPLGATSTANITITAVLAVFTFVVTNASGTKDYWKHIFWPPGVPLPVKFVLVPIEFIGIFIKPFVLAVRLFANMTAGHLVILSLLGLIFSFKSYFVAPVSVGFALFIYLIEVLVAFLQAYIFVMLSALYIGTAVEEHDHHDHGHGESHDHSLETEPVLAG